jgi:hypothetical protein
MLLKAHISSMIAHSVKLPLINHIQRELLRGNRQQTGNSEPILKRMGLKQGRFVFHKLASQNNSLFKVGSLPTTKVIYFTVKSSLSRRDL